MGGFCWNLVWKSRHWKSPSTLVLSGFLQSVIRRRNHKFFEWERHYSQYWNAVNILTTTRLTHCHRVSMKLILWKKDVVYTLQVQKYFWRPLDWSPNNPGCLCTSQSFSAPFRNLPARPAVLSKVAMDNVWFKNPTAECWVKIIKICNSVDWSIFTKDGRETKNIYQRVAQARKIIGYGGQRT